MPFYVTRICSNDVVDLERPRRPFGGLSSCCLHRLLAAFTAPGRLRMSSYPHTVVRPSPVYCACMTGHTYNTTYMHTHTLSLSLSLSLFLFLDFTLFSPFRCFVRNLRCSRHLKAMLKGAQWEGMGNARCQTQHLYAQQLCRAAQSRHLHQPCLVGPRHSPKRG